MNRSSKRIMMTSLAAGAYFLGQAIAWNLVGSTTLKAPNMPPSASPESTAAWFMVCTALIASGVAPIAASICGGRLDRWATLSALIYLLHTANTAIELTVFTKFEGQAYLALAGTLPALACAGVLIMLNRSGPRSRPNLHIDGSLAWRLAVCWLSYPLVYYVFGSLVIPFVLDAYMDEKSMLVIPPPVVLLSVQCIRSMIFMLPSIAVIERWPGSRIGLWAALGWAHTALVGLAGLVMPNAVLTPTLRVVHSVEIAADSFTYAGILVLILAAKSAARTTMEFENEKTTVRTNGQLP